MARGKSATGLGCCRIEADAVIGDMNPDPWGACPILLRDRHLGLAGTAVRCGVEEGLFDYPVDPERAIGTGGAVLAHCSQARCDTD